MGDLNKKAVVAVLGALLIFGSACGQKPWVAEEQQRLLAANEGAYIDPNTGQVVGAADFSAQAERVFQNLRRALTSVGGSLDDIVKTTTFITDLKNVPALRDVRGKHLHSRRPPANTLLVVSSLARPELMIEVEAVAILPQGVRFTQ